MFTHMHIYLHANISILPQLKFQSEILYIDKFISIFLLP